MEDTKEWLDSREEIEAFTSHGDVGRPRQDLHWQKPSLGWVKCNFYASHYEGDRPSGLGWIIRNNEGMFLSCAMGKFQGRHTVEEAESNALIWAIQAVWRLGDNKKLMEAVNSNSRNLRLQHYLCEIRQWRQRFDAIKFSYQSRNRNTSADLLARKCISSNENLTLYNFMSKLSCFDCKP